MTTLPHDVPDESEQRPVDLLDDALLWLINRCIFHPRGYALGYDNEEHSFVLLGNGTDPYVFDASDIDEVEKLRKIKELMP